MGGTIAFEMTGGVARLVLDAPERRNPLGVATLRELRSALEACGADTDVRVVVIAATGPAFSAGHDLKEMLGADLDSQRLLFDECCALMATVHQIPQPVIAEVDGLATAAGCQLVATCDLVVASERSRFATPGVRIGLFCSTPMVALSRAIGRKRAMEMLLTGEPIDARTAAEWGLVNRVVPESELRTTVDALVAAICRSSLHTIAVGKAAFYEQIDMTEPDAYTLTREVMSVNAVHPVAQEGIDAFLAKRDPVWPDNALE